jgi:hypothetical protein
VKLEPHQAGTREGRRRSTKSSSCRIRMLADPSVQAGQVRPETVAGARPAARGRRMECENEEETGDGKSGTPRREKGVQ